MTRIHLILDPASHLVYTTDDPRPRRELCAAINTGEYVVGEGSVRFYESEQQWARGLPPLNLIVVVLQPPPIHLTAREYQILFGIADGKRAQGIADDLGLTRRTVYFHTERLKQKFRAITRMQLLLKAERMGWL